MTSSFKHRSRYMLYCLIILVMTSFFINPVSAAPQPEKMSDESLLFSPPLQITTDVVRPGFDAQSLPGNDDGSTGLIPLGFNVNFFGNTFHSLYVNNNGNVTFDSALSTFTPFNLSTTNRVIIAAFFADVDTRVGNITRYGVGNVGGRTAFGVTWPGVGCYQAITSVLNEFQLILIDRSDIGPGDFDIEFNYDQIQWEAGTASGGSSTCQGGSPARVGYSNGSTVSFELPGSGVQGAFLDSNAISGLIHNSRNSLDNGRYVFPVRNGVAPTGGTISGHVFANNTSTPVDGAFVQVCGGGGFCNTTQTTASGTYSVSGLAAGAYTVRANPPGNLSLNPGQIGPITLPNNATLTDQDIILTGPQPLPNGTTITNIGTGGGGIPIIYWQDDLTLTTTGCPGGTASYQVILGGTVIRSGGMTEAPAGTFTAVIPHFYPMHGYAQIIITINCPGVPPTTVTFDIYIDPSGHVRTVDGTPIPDATVTLLRSDSSSGPFTVVPNGSGIMSLSNRVNPDTTDSEGRFGWDVIAGYYIVRAERAGCVSPTNSAQTFTESAVLTIPPPVTDLDLRLDCPSFGADVGVTQTDAPDPVNVGASLTYTLTVTNSGPTNATNVSLVDTMPAGVSFVSATPGQGTCSEASGTVTCSLGSLANGGSTQVTIIVIPGAPGSITNNASVSASEADSNQANNTSSADTTVNGSANQPPLLAANQPSVTVNEGTTAANQGTVSDPNGDPLTLSASVGVVVDNGDGTWSWSFTPDDGPTQSQTVTLSASDGINPAVSVTFALVVNNVSPTATFANTSGAVPVGGTAMLAFTSPFDPSTADTTAGFLYSYDCTNDGSFELADSASATYGCVYTAFGTFTAKGRIADNDGDFTDYFAEVSVLNTAGLAVERLDRYTGFRDEPTFVAEGATIGDRFRIHLATQPTADVTVQVRSVDPADLTLRGAGFAAVNSVTVTFRYNDNNPTNSVLGWGDWFSLSVSGVADNLVEGAEIHNLEYVLTSADPNYNGLVVAPEPVTVYDAGVVVTPLVTQMAEGTIVDYYSVVLSGPPGLTLPSNTPETVTVSITLYDFLLLRNVTPTVFTFDRSNWNVPQIVSIHALAPGVTTITHAVSSDVATLDSRYGGAGPNVSVGSVTVTIVESLPISIDISDGLPGADLEVTGGWVVSAVGQGSPAVLQVNLRNTGTVAASDVQVSIGALSSGQLTLVGASGAGAYDPLTDTWSLPSVPADGSTLTLQLTVTPTAAGVVTVAPALSHLDIPDTDSSNNGFSASLEVVNGNPGGGDTQPRDTIPNQLPIDPITPVDPDRQPPGDPSSPSPGG